MQTTQKYSRKREAILEALRQCREHPSAEWLYQHLKPQYPDLSLGTVYRNLQLFRKEGKVMVVGSVNGQERFDAFTEAHSHFICDRCGAVLDVNIPLLENLEQQMADYTGGAVRCHEILFRGTCQQCRQ